MEQLKTMLDNVSDTYPDFMKAVLSYAEESTENLDVITAYIKSHPQANTSQIGRFLIDQPNFLDTEEEEARAV